MEKLAQSKLSQTIRILSAAGVEKADSGHPGMPMGTADLAAILWSEFLKFNPQDTNWAGRDHFVLSAGHGSMLLYSLLHLFGYDLPMEELKNFRQWGSKTPGHPEFGLTPGVEVTTGPLGQGFANGVGMALSVKLMQARYDKQLFNKKVFGIVSDGDLMEGVASEAASLAGHWKLNNLIYIYDDNDISIGGSTDICFTESVPKRFQAYGWNVIEIDGHNTKEIRQALTSACVEEHKPTIICARTHIGFGSPNKVDTADVHGAPLGKDEFELAKKQLGWEYEENFFVPQEVADFCKNVVNKNQEAYNQWQEDFKNWQNNNPELASTYIQQTQKEIPAALEEELFAELSKIEKDATRNVSGKAIQIIAKYLPGFIGGSADLEPSNKTLIKDAEDISAENFSGKNIRFGVREHAMGSIVNGMAYSGNWFPYSGTFLVFADYMRPPMRLAALSHLQSLFIFTHDSYFVGEDGPTHQPIEHVASLRIIPNLDVYRPADGPETAACYMMALQRKNHPATLLFTRQNLPLIEREAGFSRKDLFKGGYIVSGKENEDLVLVATGSEVSLAVEVAKQNNARVVSIPCMEVFLEQDETYRNQVIPPKAKKVLLEAGISAGWGNVLGENVTYITKEDFGASAPHSVLAEKFGFTPEAVLQKIS